MGGIGAIFGGGGAPKGPDMAAQAAAQQAAREAEQAAQLAADRNEAQAKAESARDAESTRLKRLKGQQAAQAIPGTGQLAATTEQSTLKAKLG